MSIKVYKYNVETEELKEIEVSGVQEIRELCPNVIQIDMDKTIKVFYAGGDYTSGVEAYIQTRATHNQITDEWEQEEVSEMVFGVELYISNTNDTALIDIEESDVEEVIKRIRRNRGYSGC